jgi:hypothetical protein
LVSVPTLATLTRDKPLPALQALDLVMVAPVALAIQPVVSVAEQVLPVQFMLNFKD